MEFNSILYSNKKIELQLNQPLFFRDLQLDYILELLNNMSHGYSIDSHFYTLPCDKEVIRFRREVYGDIMTHSLEKDIQPFCRKMRKAQETFEQCNNGHRGMKFYSYHLEAAIHYWEGLCFLEEALKDKPLSSQGFLLLKEYVKNSIQRNRENGFEEAMRRAQGFFEKIRFQIIVEPEKISITEENEDTVDYIAELKDLLSDYTNEDETGNFLPEFFPNSTECSNIEETLILLLSKNNPEIFDEIEKFAKKYVDFMDSKILRFSEEIQCYFAFYEFQKKTERLGYFLHMPEIMEGTTFEGQGLYDISLVWKSAGRNYEIISNDFNYSHFPAFFVVTGPNQGGKTTFARSMGQAIYFALMGFPVNAKQIHMPFFDGLATHFEAEEQMQSNSGKLKEEIERLTPMMQQEKTNQFVILNELFTTATTYDAEIMGKKVMEHFLRANCCGIYVTHIQELAEESDSIISLVAQMEEGSSHRRTYRMIPMKAQGYGYSDSLVNEFELSYEDIIRRLS